MPSGRPGYRARAGQDNPVRLVLLLAQQVAQMEQRPPVTLVLVAGEFKLDQLLLHEMISCVCHFFDVFFVA